jgi:hypothetical protein
MYEACERLAPFRAEVRERMDGAAYRRADERFAATPEGLREGWRENVEKWADQGRYADYEAAVRLTVESPERMRMLSDAEGREPVERARGSSEAWWIDDWLDPVRLLGALVVEYAGERSVANRRTIVVRGRPRSDSDGGEQFTLLHLGRGADAYELDVDAQLGMLLRTSSLLDGREYLVREALALEPF